MRRRQGIFRRDFLPGDEVIVTCRAAALVGGGYSSGNDGRDVFSVMDRISPKDEVITKTSTCRAAVSSSGGDFSVKT